MTKDEIKEIHSKHKRDADLAAEVKRKSDFEVNMEDEDDDFAGPSIGLFASEE